MLRTNSKKYIANIENYLIDAIYTEEHKTEATTDAQKIALELAKQLQEVERYNEKTEQRICENYFNFMAYHILKLNNKLN